MGLFPRKNFHPKAVINKKGFTPLQILHEFLSHPALSTSKRCFEVERAGSGGVYSSGFTLIEVMVAAMIIVILAAGLFGAFTGAQHFLNRSRHRMQAYNFATEAMDRLRGNYQYAQNPQMDPVPISGMSGSQIGMTDATIAGQMEVTSATLTYDVTEPQANGYKQVTVKVHWYEPAF